LIIVNILIIWLNCDYFQELIDCSIYTALTSVKVVHTCDDCQLNNLAHKYKLAVYNNLMRGFKRISWSTVKELTFTSMLSNSPARFLGCTKSTLCAVIDGVLCS